MSIKLSSWNVNGIRACYNNGGLLKWVKKTKPKIFCLQEIKANEDQIPDEVKNLKGYDWTFFSAEKKGYSGTAVACASDLNIIEIKKGLGKKEFDNEGRSISVITDDFIFMGAYFPNGSRDHSRVPFKLSFYDAFLKEAFKLKKKYNLPIIATGDFNTAHTEIDLANPKTNHKTTGFLPEERVWVDKYLKKGFVDIYREMEPSKRPYTWWSYRNNCRERDIGWRIDYFLITEELKNKVLKVEHQKSSMGSDHCPITMELDL